MRTVYPTENLEASGKMGQRVLDRMRDSPEFEISALNFSCYGAVLVHIDENGNSTLPPLQLYETA